MGVRAGRRRYVNRPDTCTLSSYGAGWGLVRGTDHGNGQQRRWWRCSFRRRSWIRTRRRLAVSGLPTALDGYIRATPVDTGNRVGVRSYTPTVRPRLRSRPPTMSDRDTRTAGH